MFLTVDKDGAEYIFEQKPWRDGDIWYINAPEYLAVPRGTIKRILGYAISWEDEAVEVVSYENRI